LLNPETMNLRIPLLLSLLFAAAPAFSQQAAPAQAPAAGAHSQMSAVSTLWAFGRERGTHELSRVVGVVGFFGQDQPRQWRLLAHDAQQRGVMREYILENGRVVAERRFARDPKQDMPSIVIPVGQLKVDSKQAFLLAEAQATAANIGFDSAHYQLRCRDLRNEPVWVLNLSDTARKTVGVVYISALNGDIIRKVWSRPGSKEYNAQGAKSQDLGDYLEKSKGFLTNTFRSLKAKAAGGQTAKGGDPATEPSSPQKSGAPQPRRR
jgi:hypothetical protein